MIVGLGTDIILIDRVVEAIDNKTFLNKIFSENEILMIEENKKVSASNFCVKEAYVKALGTGFRNINPKDIEVLRDDLGKPYINIIGKLREKIENDTNILVTISHSDEYVTSTVIIERCK